MAVVGNGEYEIGWTPGQMAPGKWQTDGAARGTTDYAVVKATASGSIDRFINVDGPTTLTLQEGQTFENHAGTWVRIG